MLAPLCGAVSAVPADPGQPQRRDPKDHHGSSGPPVRGGYSTRTPLGPVRLISSPGLEASASTDRPARESPDPSLVLDPTAAGCVRTRAGGTHLGMMRFPVHAASAKQKPPQTAPSSGSAARSSQPAAETATRTLTLETVRFHGLRGLRRDAPSRGPYARGGSATTFVRRRSGVRLGRTRDGHLRGFVPVLHPIPTQVYRRASCRLVGSSRTHLGPQGAMPCGQPQGGEVQECSVYLVTVQSRCRATRRSGKYCSLEAPDGRQSFVRPRSGSLDRRGGASFGKAPYVAWVPRAMEQDRADRAKERHGVRRLVAYTRSRGIRGAGRIDGDFGGRSADRSAYVAGKQIRLRSQGRPLGTRLHMSWWAPPPGLSQPRCLGSVVFAS